MTEILCISSSGPSGTGKSTFAVAIARFLGYDLVRANSDDDLRSLLLATTQRSLILVEDLDGYLRGGITDRENAAARTAHMLSIMDGLSSCCSEERVMVGKDDVDPAVLHPGRLDMHIQFTMCDFEAFKALASNYLRLKDHKVYLEVEEGFHHAGPRLSPAELGGIMLANHGSPSRALRSVISALHHAAPLPLPPSSEPQRVSSRPPGLTSRWSRHLANASSTASEANTGSGIMSPAGGGGFAKDMPIKEIKKIYGLIKYSSRKDAGVVPVDDTPSPNGRGSDISTDKDR